MTGKSTTTSTANSEPTETSNSELTESSNSEPTQSSNLEPAESSHRIRKMTSSEYGIGSGVTALQRASVIKSRRRARLDNLQKRWKETVAYLSLGDEVLTKANLHSFADVLATSEEELGLLMSHDQVPLCDFIFLNTRQYPPSPRKCVSDLLLLALAVTFAPNAKP